jgi:hypothetical protein
VSSSASLADPKAPVQRRIGAVDWERVEADLAAQGFAVVEGLLSASECRSIAGLYPDEARFRSHIVMARHGFGRGEYKYFAYPLPDLISSLRSALYPQLASVANRWNEALGIDARYPAEHAAFLKRCHDAGAIRARRLQLPAPGPLWRARLSPASGDPAVGA